MIYLISLSSFKEYLSFYPYSSWVLPRKKDVWQKLCHQENGSILGFEGNTRPKAEWQCACHGPFAGGLQSSIFLDLTGLTPEPGIPLISRNGICSQTFSIFTPEGSLMGISIFLVVLAEQVLEPPRVPWWWPLWPHLYHGISVWFDGCV